MIEHKETLMGAQEKLYFITRGSVSNCSLSYNPQVDIKVGTTVNITVNASSGYRNPWVTVSKDDGSGNVTVSGSGSSRSFVMPKSNVTITAGAERIPTYSVSGSASGGGISFSKTSGIYEGETITVYLSPNAYYNLSSLTSSPSVSFSGSGNTRTFRMPASNVRVTATFVAMYNLAVVVGNRGDYYGADPELGYGSIIHNSSRADVLRVYTYIRVLGSTLRVTSGASFPIKIQRLDNSSSVTFNINSITVKGVGLFNKEDLNKTIYMVLS